MIYTTGTIAISGNTVTGTGTNFSAPLSLIRVGCTLIAVGNPVQIFTITEIKSGTELSVTPAANPAIAAGTKFSILLSDSISVDGLAQDVAETLRFYQEKEDEISSAIDGSNIGLGPEPRDCIDISGDPSSYVGFLRIKETATGFPTVAAGESFLSGFICQRDCTPSYTGVFVGWDTRSLYSYTWASSLGANWTRHANFNGDGTFSAPGGLVTHTDADWNDQQSDNINKLKPIAGQTNTPENNVVYGGFHVGFSGNCATQFAGRNSKFYARSFEAGVDKGWRQLATLSDSNKWTASQNFVSSFINSDDFARKLTLGVSENVKVNSRLHLWGSDSRPSVFEYGFADPSTGAANGYGFYCQLNTDNSVSFNIPGSVSCITVIQSSDRDLKDNIQVIGDATEAIRKMNGYTYTLKENGMPYAGVIAQEVMEALPEAVGSFTHYGKALQGPTIDGNELREETRYLNVDYAAVTGLLVQVARETDNRVTELEEENASLRDNIAAMDERIAKLEELVSKLTGSEK
ncbi:tail fiber domain-containing protein [Escherichia coli]|uniref:tail fiber domain-containing protein n=1 Tax=Escherichia coli TaxID=562 RepID=UPI001FF50D9C|nr:tail fiber domain-containing protein [Escherichia coli]